jgi:hypothetical protein
MRAKADEVSPERAPKAKHAREGGRDALDRRPSS